MTRRDGTFIAVDVGASSGQVIHGAVASGHIELTEIRRLRNGLIRLPDGLYLDALGIFADILSGVRQTVSTDPDGLGMASTPGRWTTDSSTTTLDLADIGYHESGHGTDSDTPCKNQ
jgi:hypothetical protein